MQKPPSDAYKVAADVESQCGKCHRTTTHTIVTIEGGLPKKVLCQVCKAQHNYRKPPDTAKSKKQQVATKVKKTVDSKKKKIDEDELIAADFAGEITADDDKLFWGQKPFVADDETGKTAKGKKAAPAKPVKAKPEKELKVKPEKEPKVKVAKPVKEPKEKSIKTTKTTRGTGKTKGKGQLRPDGLEDLDKLQSEWDVKDSKNDKSKDQQYKQSGVYDKDQIISHSVFGRGRILDVIHPNKIRVFFGETRTVKTLIMKVSEEKLRSSKEKEKEKEKGKSKN